MSIGRLLLWIGLMALVSYLPRMLPLAIFRKRIENPRVQSFLNYMPYAVLGAMTFPDILFSTNADGLTGQAMVLYCLIPAVLGLIVAFLLAYKEKGLLPVALGATGVVFVSEQLMKWIF